METEARSSEQRQLTSIILVGGVSFSDFLEQWNESSEEKLCLAHLSDNWTDVIGLFASEVIEDKWIGQDVGAGGGSAGGTDGSTLSGRVGTFLWWREYGRLIMLKRRMIARDVSKS